MKTSNNILSKTITLVTFGGLMLFSFFIKGNHLFYFYEQNIFLPYQKFRAILLSHISFSLGDILYIFIIIGILIFIVYCIIYFKRCLQKKANWSGFIFPTIITILSIYLIYFFSWGANYNRQSIWKPQEEHQWSKDKLVLLNNFLIDKLNSLEEIPGTYDLSTINQEIRTVYQNEYGNKIPYLEVKPSLFSNLIFHLGIQGYYNPISGEAQFAKQLPSFMWGFVIAHEMAHQAGIAAEGDANMMAYVICMKSKIDHLKYSAYFNLFLYANKELSKMDSTLAFQKKELLTISNKNNIEYLKNLRLQYKSIFRGTVLDIYDWALKIQGQKQGLNSYNDISRLIYFWEMEGNPKMKLY